MFRCGLQKLWVFNMFRIQRWVCNFIHLCMYPEHQFHAVEHSGTPYGSFTQTMMRYELQNVEK